MKREVLPLMAEVHIQPQEALHPRETYLGLNKGFGSVPLDQLMELALSLESSSQPLDLAVAGSAMVEATLFSPYRNEETADDDRYMVEYGIVLMQESAAAHWDELERGLLHYNDQTTVVRSEVAAAFGPIYLDLLEGEITDTAREQTYSQLAYWGDYILKLGHDTRIYGLAYEIATLMGGLTNNESIVIPATPRGDNGIHNPSTTHDFTHLTLDEDGFIKTIMPLELKNEGDEERRFDNARRYSQHHVVVLDANNDLALHKGNLRTIFSQRSINPAARRNLVSIRSGIFNRVTEAEREFGANY